MNETIHRINVYWLNLDSKGHDIDELARQLNVDERERVANYSTLIQRRRAIFRMALRRQVLAEFLGTAPEEVVFDSTSTGKPIVTSANHVNLGFSSSHREGTGLIAVVQDEQIGVDVESVSEMSGSYRLTPIVATPQEDRELNSLPPNQLARAMLRLWTRKEAYLKATGKGIGAGFQHVSVPFGPIPQGHLLKPSDLDTPWLLFELGCPHPNLNAALVVSTDGIATRNYRIDVTYI